MRDNMKKESVKSRLIEDRFDQILETLHMCTTPTFN